MGYLAEEYELQMQTYAERAVNVLVRYMGGDVSMRPFEAIGYVWIASKQHNEVTWRAMKLLGVDWRIEPGRAHHRMIFLDATDETGSLREVISTFSEVDAFVNRYGSLLRQGMKRAEEGMR